MFNISRETKLIISFIIRLTAIIVLLPLVLIMFYIMLGCAYISRSFKMLFCKIKIKELKNE